MSQGVDDTIVCLMSMGFDIQDCQDAINFGKNTVEAAVEWLVAGKPGLHTSGATAGQRERSLKLRPTTSTFYSDAKPVPFQKPYPVPESLAQMQSSSSQSEKCTVSGDSTLDANQSDVHVVSRMHMSDAQRKFKENFQQKKIDEAKKQAILEKREQKEAHARILKEIAEDREKKKLFQPTQGHSETSNVSADADLPKVNEVIEERAGQSGSSGNCLLQIRLPDGRCLRQSFSAASTLQQVWKFTARHHQNISEFIFIQPFPHHEFSSTEMSSSLEDLKLVPTGSLVLQKKVTSALSAESGTVPEPVLASPSSSVLNVNRPSHVYESQQSHQWGQGHSLETANEASQDISVAAGGEMMEEGEEEGEEGDANNMAPGAPGPGRPLYGLQRGIIGQQMPPPPGNIMGQGHDIFGMQIVGEGNNLAFGGVGQRLVAMGDPSHNDAYQYRSVRELALEGAQARLAEPAQEQRQSPGSSIGSNLSSVHHPVHSLLVHCLKHITSRLNDPRHQLLSLAGISEDMAQVILEFLIKEKQLKPKTLNAFIPCFLRKLVLDCYPYATNELLHSVRLHTNLLHLSLSACPLITDAGLQCLTTLKKLKKLNLSCCKQLSNKCVSALSSLQSLVSLNVEDTGLTDQGVIEYLWSRPEHLHYLNLTRTAVSQAIISYIHLYVRQLRFLYLEDTKVMNLSGIKECEHLESLNVARTSIFTESMVCVANHPGLRSLNISSTDNVNGDEALQYLTGVNLHTLGLPSRHTTTNLGMQYISALPLTSLDLTNYILVGDEAMQYIGKMASLKQLILSNTRLTDAGMFFLEGLKQLEVFHFERTSVTDEGAQMIAALTSLVELSMASTRVTSKFLLSGVCKNCSNLAKLNLSKTAVTKKGILNLSLPFLQMINLDGTKVTPDLDVAMVAGCPRLAQISMRNLEPFTRDDEIEEAEMEI